MIAPPDNKAHNQKAMLNVPVTSARKPATAGPVTCLAPKNIVMKLQITTRYEQVLSQRVFH